MATGTCIRQIQSLFQNKVLTNQPPTHPWKIPTFSKLLTLFLFGRTSAQKSPQESSHPPHCTAMPCIDKGRSACREHERSCGFSHAQKVFLPCYLLVLKSPMSRLPSGSSRQWHLGSQLPGSPSCRQAQPSASRWPLTSPLFHPSLLKLEVELPAKQCSRNLLLCPFFCTPEFQPGAQYFLHTVIYGETAAKLETLTACLLSLLVHRQIPPLHPGISRLPGSKGTHGRDSHGPVCLFQKCILPAEMVVPLPASCRPDSSCRYLFFWEVTLLIF